MNPEVRALVARLLANDIPMDVFLARMGQLGITPSEAQTIASNASGGTRQTIDPSLSTEIQPLGDADRAMVSQMSQPAPTPATIPATAPGAAPPRRNAAPPAAPSYAGLTPTEAAVAKAQDASNAEFWSSMRGAPETPISQRRPSYQTLAALGARSQAVDPEKAAAAQARLDQALQRINAAPAQSVVSAPNSYQPGFHSERAEEGPRMPYGDTMPRDYHSDRAEEGPTYGSTVQNAINLAKRTAGSPQVAAAQAQPASPASSDLLHTLIRGRFGDAAKGSPMDDRLTAFQEARDKSGEARASGGAVNGKEAALHKALEIIHHLIRAR